MRAIDRGGGDAEPAEEIGHIAVRAEHHDPRIGPDEGRRHQNEDRQRRDQRPAPDAEPGGEKRQRHPDEASPERPHDAHEQRVFQPRDVIVSGKDLHIVVERQFPGFRIEEAEEENARDRQDQKNPQHGDDADRGEVPEIDPARQTGGKGRCGHQSLRPVS